MSLSRLSSKCLIRPDDIKPCKSGFKVIGTFNPGVTSFDGGVYFLVRVAEIPEKKRDGYIALPFVENGDIRFVWEKTEDVDIIDQRLVRLKESGLLRLTNLSHLRLAKSSNGVDIDSISEKPAMFPKEPYEEFGIEDARITFIDDRFYITYVAVSRHGVVTALASTSDFISFERHGVIFPTDNKDVVIFPEKVKGKYFAFHRPLSAAPFALPEMWTASSPDLLNWGEHKCIYKSVSTGGFKHDTSFKLGAGAPPDSIKTDEYSIKYDTPFKVGAGVPPIKTQDGWLEVYHGSYKSHKLDTVGRYWGRAALFDLHEPYKLLSQSVHPILVPETEYDCHGFLDNIVFPTGVVRKGSSLLVYYGAADTYTAVAELSYQDVLNSIKV